VLEKSGYLSKHENECSNKDPKRPKPCEQNSQLNSIENYLIKDSDGNIMLDGDGEYRTWLPPLPNTTLDIPVYLAVGSVTIKY
jgi:hypothetical protein